MIHDYRLAIFNTMKKGAYLRILGYHSQRIDQCRSQITILQILSLKGAHLQHSLRKMLGGSCTTTNIALKVLVEHGYINYSMKPIKHKTGFGEIYQDRKAYNITPTGRDVLRRLTEYIDGKMDEVRANPTNKRIIIS